METGRNKRSVTPLLFRALLVLMLLSLSLVQVAPLVYGQSEPICTDSDGGWDYEVAGYVQGIGPNGWPYTKYDVCQTGDDEGTLKEFYCNGTAPWPKYYQCPYGCADGACLPVTCTDADGDGYAVEGGACGLVDCDDGDPAVNPGAAEVCDNGSDDDCNGLMDADDPACLICTDADRDGYAVEGGACGLVDCDDGDPAVNPGAAEVCDNGSDDDCDGLIDADDPICPSCTDSDGSLNYEVAGYVEGTGPNGWPYTKYDVCQTGDDEGTLKEFYCNGTAPWPKYYQCPYGCADGACLPWSSACTDADGDGYAVEGGACGPVDCDDGDPAVNPGAAEVCDNGSDDDCNGLIDADDPECAVCTDADGDGYAVEGGACGPVDCDAGDPAVNPGAAEVCDNGSDDDCDGLIDADDPICPSCTDSDGGLNYEVAGYVEGTGPNSWPYTKYDVCETGDLEGQVREFYCNGTAPWPKYYQCPYGCADGACLPWSSACTDADGDGYAVEGGACGLVDCDDGDPAVNPDAAEVCENGSDDDCDGLIDADDLDCLVCTDADGDGYAVEGSACGPVDCDDTNPQVNRDAVEICDNGIDDNCNSSTDAEDPICSSPPNIIVLGWDGTQRDHFWQCYNKELPECPDGLPNIQALSGGVIFNSTTTNGETSTKPGWAQIFTGYNAEVTGVFMNGDYQPIPEGYTVFEKIENHFGVDNVVTMFISGKGVNTGGACVGDPTTKGGQPVIEDKGQPWCLTKEHLDYYENDLRQNQVVGNRALELLETHQHDLFFALFHFRDPDAYGHLLGENSVAYSEQMIDVDYWLGRIVAKLHELGIYEQTLVYVTTDHGFDEGDDRHLNAPYGIFAANDPSVVRSGDRKDIAPTFLERYGISLGAIGSAPAVDGYSLYSIPPLACIPEGEAYVDYAGAPVCCAGLQLIGLDRKIGSNCFAPTGGTGDNSGYCTNCGNGVCESPENHCICPEDCPPPPA